MMRLIRIIWKKDLKRLRIEELLVEFEENKNPNRKIKIYGDN
jgi:hypothetical protein